MSSYRTKQLRKLAPNLGFKFSEKDEFGLIELVKGSSLKPKFPIRDKRNIFNILTSKNIWKHHSVYIFDMHMASSFYPVRTVMLIKSTNHQFPYVSIQPSLEYSSPVRPLSSLRRLRTYHERKIKYVSSSSNYYHQVYVEDLDYWDDIKLYIAPIMKEQQNALLEADNFFFFYSPSGSPVFTTRIEEMIHHGREIIKHLSTKVQ